MFQRKLMQHPTRREPGQVGKLPERLLLVEQAVRVESHLLTTLQTQNSAAQGRQVGFDETLAVFEGGVDGFSRCFGLPEPASGVCDVAPVGVGGPFWARGGLGLGVWRVLGLLGLLVVLGFVLEIVLDDLVDGFGFLEELVELRDVVGRTVVVVVFFFHRGGWVEW